MPSRPTAQETKTVVGRCRRYFQDGRCEPTTCIPVTSARRAISAPIVEATESPVRYDDRERVWLVSPSPCDASRREALYRDADLYIEVEPYFGTSKARPGPLVRIDIAGTRDDRKHCIVIPGDVDDGIAYAIGYLSAWAQQQPADESTCAAGAA